MRRKPRVRLIDSETPNWKAHIDKSRIYVCYITSETLRSPRMQEQLAYANARGKPMRVFVQGNTSIPPGMFAPFADCQLFVVNNPEEMADITMRLLEEMRQETTDA